MGKKNKSVPKTKPKPIIEEEPKNQQTQQKKKLLCSSCRQEIKTSVKQNLQCTQCKKITHPQCYSSKYNQKKFICDMCQHNKRKITCIYCKKYEKSQMLKYGGDNIYFHIDCAMLNSQSCIESYEKLKISFKKGNQKEVGSCTFCQKQEANIFKCLFCQQTAHYKCLSQYIHAAQNKNQQIDYYFSFRWLDKNQKQNYLLHYICFKKNSHLKDLLKIQDTKKIRQLIICPHHSWQTKQFSWCPCDMPQKNNQTQGHQSVYCDDCDRCIHRQCTGLVKKKLKQPFHFSCQGCKKNDIFKKQLKINEQIRQAIRLQSMDVWGKNEFRFLNSFVFQYSQVLEKKIQEYKKEIEIYFIEKSIQVLKDKKITVQGIDNQKCFKMIMYYILQEDQEVYRKKLENQKEVQQMIRAIKQNQFLKRANIPLILDKIIQYLHQIGESIKINQRAGIMIQKLKSFNQQCNTRYPQNSENSQICRVAVLIKQIANEMNEVMNCESKLKVKIKTVQGNINSIFRILIKNKLSLSMIQTILKHYKIIKQCIEDDNCMNEDDYNLLLSGNYGDTTQQQRFVTNTIHNYFKQILNKQIKLRYKAVQKQNLWKNILNRLKSKFHTQQQIRKNENELISKKICFGGGQQKDNILNNLNMSRMQFNILKKKYLCYAKEAQRSITDKHVKIYGKLNQFKYNNVFLRPHQIRILHKFSIKILFHLQIVKKGKILLVNSIQQSEDVQNSNGMNGYMNGKMIQQQEQSIQKQQIIQNLHKIIENWHSNIISTETMLINLGMLANQNIQFNTNCQRRKLKDLAINVLNEKKQEQLMGNLIKGKQIRNIYKIIQYFKLQGDFPQMQQKYQSYIQWVQLLNVKGTQVSSILQKLQSTQNLLRNIQILLGSANQLNLNLGQQINKLCTIRQWCKLSQKVLSSKRKPSINAINYLKILVQKTRYPNNGVKINIINLDSQGKLLNKQISKFLDKPKFQDFMEIYDQLKFIQGKISGKQAMEMRNAFEDAQLDISAQIQQLQSQLKQFQQLPTDLTQVIQRGNYKQLTLLRQKLLNLAIKHQRIDQYQKLLRKIYEIKCINFSSPITRKQYFQLLSLGGEASIYLMDKTQNLFKAYKLIEKAENELLINPIRKRNFSNLISMQQRKIKQIKQDLRIDTIQVNNFEKARLYVMKLRQSYYRYRRERAQIQKYSQLQDQLLTSIFNTKDIIGQISMIKRQFNESYKRVMDAIQYGQTDLQGDQSYQNILMSNRDGKNYCLQRYIHSGIKNSLMQIYSRDCKVYAQFQQLHQNLDLLKYRKFSYVCDKFSQWAKRIDAIIQKRQLFFAKAYDQVINNKQIQSNIQLCRALVEQGSSLRIVTLKKQQYLNYIFQINQILKKYGPSQDDPIEDDSDQDNDIVDSNQDDDGFDQSDDDQDECDSDHDIGVKRPRDNNQIVLDDDEQ